MRKDKQKFGSQPTANRPIVPDPSNEADPVKSFMTTNAQDTFPKDTEDDKIGSLSLTEASTEPPTDAPAVETAPAEEPKPAEPAVDPAADPATEPPATDAPSPDVEKPATAVAPEPTKETPATAAVAPVEPVAPEPPAPSYAADEKIYLVEGSDPWTREQVVAALHERSTLQPRAQEAENFQKLFGFDYEKAEQQWKPILDILRNDPARTNFLDEVTHAEPELLQYLRDSAAYFKSQQTGAPAGTPAATDAKMTAAVTPATDPRLDEVTKYIEKQKQQAAIDRANREINTVFERYPFFRTDTKAFEGLRATTNILFDLDRKAGKDELECRGLLDALELNAAIYDAMSVARKAAEPPSQPPALVLDPVKGREGMLGSSGPTPSGASRPARQKDYNGNPDDAVAAFLAEHPGS